MFILEGTVSFEEKVLLTLWGIPATPATFLLGRRRIPPFTFAMVRPEIYTFETYKNVRP